jgi:hypothetical protein
MNYAGLSIYYDFLNNYLRLIRWYKYYFDSMARKNVTKMLFVKLHKSPMAIDQKSKYFFYLPGEPERRPKHKPL